jgi:hypothetical protein
MIENVPEFSRRIKKVIRGKGSEGIELRTGQEITFTTRAGGGGRGLTADVQVYDEAMFLSDQDRSSLAPTMAALSMHGNVQTWYAGSAVDQQDPSHNGVPFAQVRESGVARTPGVAYFEWSIPGDDPARVPPEMAADPGMQDMANPGSGIRISREWMEHERLVEMGPRGYAVERLGVGDWPDTSSASDRVISVQAWAACAERDRANRIVGVETYGVDCNVSQTWGSITAVGERADGLPQGAVHRHDRGTDWIVPECVTLREASPESRIVVDPRGPAAHLIADLKDAGIEPVEISTSEYGDACADIKREIEAAAFRYPFPQPELSDAVADARQQAMGDRWKWSRRNSSSADISPLVALTLARWGMSAGSEFTSVMFPSDYANPENEAAVGDARDARGEVLGQVRFIEASETFSCFRCATGSYCELHGGGGS